jgi:hypothetical protein
VTFRSTPNGTKTHQHANDNHFHAKTAHIPAWHKNNVGNKQNTPSVPQQHRSNVVLGAVAQPNITFRGEKPHTAFNR